MIHESYPWKQDLLLRRSLILRYNKSEKFEKNEEKTLTTLEKAIFYSAFIIRKLLDCKGKLSDEADNYSLIITKITPNEEINRLNRWIDNETHDWDHMLKETAQGKSICNWLIHSYVFAFSFNDSGVVDGFFVSSDFDRNTSLYFIPIDEWIDYMNYIGRDTVVKAAMIYDDKIQDYKYIVKKRGE